MNIQTAHILIQQGLQKNGVFAYQDITHEEIDLHLNDELELYIKDLLKEADKPSDGYDKDHINFEILRPITYTGSPLTVDSSPTAYTGAAITYTDLFLPVKTLATVTKNCMLDGAVASVEERNVRVRIVSTEFYETMRYHSIYGTTFESPLGHIVGSVIEVSKSGFQVTAIWMIYIKTWTPIKYMEDGDGAYDSANSVQIPISSIGHSTLIQRTIARIKAFNEGNPNVIQRIDQRQQLN